MIGLKSILMTISDQSNYFSTYLGSLQLTDKITRNTAIGNSLSGIARKNSLKCLVLSVSIMTSKLFADPAGLGLKCGQKGRCPVSGEQRL